MQADDFEFLSTLDDRIITWRNVESKLDKYLSFQNEELTASYKDFLLFVQSSKRSIFIFIISHLLFLIFWFGRDQIFNYQPFGLPFQSTKLTILLDVIAVVVLLCSIGIVMTRFRPYIPPNGMLEVICNKFLELLSLWDIAYTVSFTFFLSFQMLVLVQTSSCNQAERIHCNVGAPCDGVGVQSILFAYMSSIISRYFSSTGNRFLFCFNITQSLFLVIFTIIYYNLTDSLGLIPVLYILIYILLYCYERRYRELFLLRIVGREVLKDIVSYTQNNALIAQLSKELMDIIECTAHDMKSPCTAMQLGLDALKEQVRLPVTKDTFNKAYVESCQLVHNLNSTLAYMIMQNNRSMDFAKINRGLKLVPVLDSITLRSVVEWAVNCVNWQSDETVKLVAESNALDLVGVTEKSWLRDNLLCILDNGNKHTEGEPVTIRANKLRIGGREWVEIRVTDNGPNVERTDFFEPPTHAKRKDLGGRGLGLYCLAIRVNILKGTFGADERKDGKSGTVVWFRIPFHDNKRVLTKSSSVNSTGTALRASASTKKKLGNSSTTSLGSSSGKNNPASESKGSDETASAPVVVTPDFEIGFVEKPLTTALIVDDSIPILKMSALVLEKVGCAVDKAKNGKIGLEKMQVKTYDVVVMDVQMPVMTGLDCVKRLRKFESEQVPRRVPRQLVVGVSANSEGVMKQICVEHGMDFFTIKPFVLEDILAIYRQHQLNLYVENSKKNNRKSLGSSSSSATSDMLPRSGKGINTREAKNRLKLLNEQNQIKEVNDESNGSSSDFNNRKRPSAVSTINPSTIGLFTDTNTDGEEDEKNQDGEEDKASYGNLDDSNVNSEIDSVAGNSDIQTSQKRFDNSHHNAALVIESLSEKNAASCSDDYEYSEKAELLMKINVATSSPHGNSSSSATHPTHSHTLPETEHDGMMTAVAPGKQQLSDSRMKPPTTPPPQVCRSAALDSSLSDLNTQHAETSGSSSSSTSVMSPSNLSLSSNVLLSLENKSYGEENKLMSRSSGGMLDK